jgi:DNA-binding transcriptional regulator LsrR (DeoR family)
MCLEKVSSGAKNAEIARRWGVSERTVKTALAWGRENGVFDADVTVKLEKHLQEFKARLKDLDGYLRAELGRDRKIRDASGGYEALPSKQIIIIFQEIREHQTKIMELEGIYRQYVNVSQTNNVQQNVFVVPQAAESKEDWAQVVEKFLEKQNATTQLEVAPPEGEEALEEASEADLF